MKEAKVAESLRVLAMRPDGDIYESKIFIKTTVEEARQHSDVFFDTRLHQKLGMAGR